MKAIVVAGGEPHDDDAAKLADAELVVAADGGAAWLSRKEVAPHAIVGDFDSIDPALADRYAAQGVAIERHPPDKDASDAELALAHTIEAGAGEVVILGALAGERLDHALANLLLLFDARLHGRGVRIVRGGMTIRALHAGERLAIEGAPGDVVSLLPIGAPAEGVRTVGLRYPLAAERLPLGTSRGLSNVVEQLPASVEITAGALLVVELRKEEDSR